MRKKKKKTAEGEKKKINRKKAILSEKMHKSAAKVQKLEQEKNELQKSAQ